MMLGGVHKSLLTLYLAVQVKWTGGQGEPRAGRRQQAGRSGSAWAWEEPTKGSCVRDPSSLSSCPLQVSSDLTQPPARPELPRGWEPQVLCMKMEIAQKSQSAFLTSKGTEKVLSLCHVAAPQEWEVGC